jgi:hypothetical protein
MDPPRRAIDGLPAPIVEVLRSALGPDESVTHSVAAIGCALVLTNLRLLVIREGSAFRPRTGVRDWPIGPELAVQAGLVRQGTGSLVIRSERDVTSVFVRADRWDDALDLVGAVRGRVRQARTRGRG